MKVTGESYGQKLQMKVTGESYEKIKVTQQSYREIKVTLRESYREIYERKLRRFFYGKVTPESYIRKLRKKGGESKQVTEMNCMKGIL